MGRSLGEGHGNPLQYSCLENSMDRGAWRVTVHGVTKESEKLILFISSCIMLNFSYGPYFKLLILKLCRFLESCKDSTERAHVFFSQFLPLSHTHTHTQPGPGSGIPVCSVPPLILTVIVTCWPLQGFSSGVGGGVGVSSCSHCAPTQPPPPRAAQHLCFAWGQPKPGSYS